MSIMYSDCFMRPKGEEHYDSRRLPFRLTMLVLCVLLFLTASWAVWPKMENKVVVEVYFL